MLTAERVVTLLGLEPLPEEGGEFRVTYRSPDLLAHKELPTRYGGPRALGGAIYYLLREDTFSALHRLRGDEIYHFYLGRPVELLLLHPDGRDELMVLGPDLENGQRPQVMAPQGVWQGSRLALSTTCLSTTLLSTDCGDGVACDFALLGTTMAPAHDPADFELGDRTQLSAAYPARVALIAALTR